MCFGWYCLKVPAMFKNYMKVALRNLRKNKVYSFINIIGLATGMGVALLIGLWMWDELSYDKYHTNYHRIAQVMQHNLYNGIKTSQMANPYVMGEEIKNNFGSDFKYILQASWNNTHILAHGEKILNKTGYYFEPDVTEMLTLRMLRGTRDGLKDPHSILLSESVAKSFFGDDDPMGQMMRVNNEVDVKVTGVYEDLPYNTFFRGMGFLLPWDLYLITNPWIKRMENPWGSNFTQTFVQLADGADLEKVSAKIINVKFNKLTDDGDRQYKPEVFLHPMSKWHLYSEFKNGENTGGRIEFVWMFGVIGVFVLLLACINFMNLSTARSEKRAKEVGIRKSIGSAQIQLINQFFSESLVVALLAFVVALLLVQLALPAFNQVADKRLVLPWLQPLFWLAGIGFSMITGVVAGSYPALYLSSFQPVKVLKGTFRAGRFASLPRQVLVVLQFAVSIVLIIGTVVVFRQIQFAKDQPAGYDRFNIIQLIATTPDLHNHFEAFRSELKSTGAVQEVSESGSPPTNVWNTNGGFTWKGKDPSLSVDFPNNAVTHEYGKVMGWQFKEGRDFSRDHATDSLAFVINEAMQKFLGFDHPVGEVLTWNDKSYTIIGVIRDMIIESPYEPVRPSLFHLLREQQNIFCMKLNANVKTHEALAKVATVFKKYNPSAPFDYRFVDQDYARKFGDEVRVGKLASFFATLAVFISCLGIFGLASFVAEQRTKEIGVRKVLGASIFNLWRMLSRDFVVLVLISLVLAIPVSFYAMNAWLHKYEYHTDVAWWIFVASGAGALVITLLTVSYQSIKTALANPVKSLRTE